MFAIIGIVMVFGAVIGGFLMEKGPLPVLLQPAELLIIGGAGIGTLLVANPLCIIKKLIAGLLGVLKGSKFKKTVYIESLKMMYELLNKARRQGLVALESDIEEPDKSPIFTKYKSFTSDHHLRDFVCDTMRMAVTGGVDPFDVDQMMDLDMEVHHGEITQPVAALTTVADSLPGLGIVAAALVGTFLGILLCYGAVGPLAANMDKLVAEEHAYYYVLRVVMIAFMKGISPLLAVEIGRRAIPGYVRPSFAEVEKACREAGSGAAAATAEAERSNRRARGLGEGESATARPHHHQESQWSRRKVCGSNCWSPRRALSSTAAASTSMIAAKNCW
jgi:chemotaxis protein MotA